jgi:hypothetical protein
MNRVAVLVVAAVFVLGGCAGQEATKQTTDTPSTFQTVDTGPSPDPVTTPTNLPPAVEETTPPPEEPGVAKVGPTEWFTYEDGLKVQVTKLARAKISQYASGGKPGGTAVVVTVTIRNGSGTTFDTSLVTVKVSSGPNGDEAEQVYDTGIEEFSGSIPKGRAKTARYEFAVPKAHYGQVLVEVAPSFEHNGSHFEGAAK